MTTLLPFVPDECKLTFRWSTDVLKADSGVERRICLEEYPDILLESSYTFDLSTVDEVRKRKLGFFSNPLDTFEIPWHFEAIGASALAATTIDVVQANCADWAIASRRVYVSASDDSGTAHTISTVTPQGGGITRLTLTGSLASYSLSTVTICPLYTFQPEDGQALGYQRDGKSGRWDFRGRLVGGYAQGVGVSLTQFLGLNLNDFRPEQEGNIAGEEFQAGLEFTDLGGPFTVDTGYEVADIIRDETYNIQGLTEWLKMKAFLWQARGQQKPFWTPTWKSDFELHSEFAGESYIEVQDETNPNEWFESSQYPIIWALVDGTLQVREINTIEDNGDYYTLGSTEVYLEGDASIVGMVNKTRLSGDEVVVKIGHGCSMDVSFGLQTIQHVPRWPTSAAEMQEAMGGLGTWVSAWLCDEESGTLVDAFGAVTLTPAATPEYRVAGPLDDDYAVRFTASSSDTFQAASSSTFDLGSADSIILYMCARFLSGGLLNRWIMGKAGPVANNYGFQLQSFPTGRIEGYVDSGATTIVANLDVDHYQGGAQNWHHFLLIVDRESNPEMMEMLSELGTSGPIDISTVGTLTNTLPFHVGAASSSTVCGMDVAFAAVATGGAEALRGQSALALRSIQRFTGLL